MQIQFERQDERNIINYKGLPPKINNIPCNSIVLSHHDYSDSLVLEKKRKRKPQNSREWTSDEEELICEYNKIYPHNWRHISRLLKTKTPIQCSYKFEKMFSEIKVEKFTRREDIMLIELVRENGNKWDLISKAFNGRYSKEVLKKRYYEKLLLGIVKESELNTQKKDSLVEKSNDGLNREIQKNIIISNETDSKTLSTVSLTQSNEFNSFLSHNNKDTILSKSPMMKFVEGNALSKKKKPQLFFIHKEKAKSISEVGLERHNQILRRAYKRLIQLYKIMISLHCDSGDIDLEMMNRKRKEMCLQVKNYKFKFDEIKIYCKMLEIEQIINYAREKIMDYLYIS